LNPQTVLGGTGSTGTLSLSGPAPSGGFAVAVSSSIPELASVPDTVVVLPGLLMASFPVQVAQVETQTTVTISASGGGATRTADVTLIPIAVDRVSVDPVCLSGGAGASGTLTLNAAAPSGGIVVSLASAQPDAATVPATVTVSAGSTSAMFAIQTATVSVTTSVTITATFHGSRSAVLRVMPAYTLPTYSVTDLGTLGGESSIARAINNAGQIVGEAALPDRHRRAFVWQGGAMTNLGVLPSQLDSFGWAINSTGQVAGYSTNGSLGRAYWWAGGPLIDLGTFAGLGNIQAKGINASGMIVGSATAIGIFPYHAFVWQNGIFTELPPLPGVAAGYTLANAINDAGQVVGNSGNRAFIWQAGTMSELGTGAAYALNSAGHVAGAASGHAMLWLNGTTVDLGVLAGNSQAVGLALNSLDQVVGNSTGGATSAIIASPDWCAANLNAQIPPASGWVLTVARGINDAGQIVGEGTVSGQTHAFLLTPTGG
jgi:probable HAF family extracellular repeat protein